MRSLKICVDYELCSAGVKRWLSLDEFYKEGQRVLIVGPSGSGKTVFATNLLGKLALYLNASSIYIIDPKGIDFRFCKGCANYFAIDDAPKGIEVFFELFNSRLREDSSNRKPLILFVDELSSLILSLPKKDGEVIKNKMARMLNLSRALNISVITAVQRADAILFENGARDNYNIRFLMGNIANNKESVSMIASEYKEVIEPCRTGVGYMITDRGIRKIRSLLPKNPEKLHALIKEAVNRPPESAAQP